MKSLMNLTKMVVAVGLSLAATGCLTDIGEDARSRELACVEQAIGGYNGLGFNAMWDNALWDNGLWDNGLWDNGVWDNGVWNNDFWDNGLLANGFDWNGMSYNGLSEVLTDPSARQAFEYLVSCALNSEQKVEVVIEGEPVVFAGGIGLAPEWGVGPCDQDCQELVSACMIARVNHKGESILISLRGNHSALDLEENEAEVFSWEEGTYYGNLFTRPQQFYACLPDHSDELMRVCGPSLDDCFLDVTGRCSRVCEQGVCQNAITVFRPPEEVLNACN